MPTPSTTVKSPPKPQQLRLKSPAKAPQPSIQREKTTTKSLKPAPAPAVRRSTRENRGKWSKKRFGDEAFYANHAYSKSPVSTHALAFAAAQGKAKNPDLFSWDEAMRSSDRKKWIEAAQVEVDALVKQDTWKEVPMSEAKTKILPGTWAFRRKRSPDGEIKKYKGRYCVRGDLEEGNTQDVYSPVVAWPTVRVFLILSLILGWKTISIDFSSAFVQSKLKEPVWIHFPRGFGSENGPNRCLRLVKSLYGLSVSPILWYETCTKAFCELGFKKSPFDPCLLYKEDMMVVLYVDDAGISFKNESDIDPLIKSLEAKGFSLTKEGSFEEFLGIKFEQTDGKIKLTQRGLIDKIARTTGLENCRPNRMPQSVTALGSDPDGKPMQEDWSYPSVVGMLLYLSCNSRPDIAFAVSQVCRFTSNPKQSHAQAVKTIVRYLHGTRNQGMILQPSLTLYLDLYVDADFCSLHGIEPPTNPNSARSRTGYIIMLCGCPLVWKSQLQSHFSQSTLEAEYSALSYALKTLLKSYLKRGNTKGNKRNNKFFRLCVVVL